MDDFIEAYLGKMGNGHARAMRAIRPQFKLHKFSQRVTEFIL